MPKTARKARPNPEKRPARARSSEPAKAKKAPVGRSLPWRRTRLRAAMQRLDKLFGEVKIPEADTALEVAVYLVVREGLSDTAACRAMSALKTDFVDWNEVRASRESELAVMMVRSHRGSVLRRHFERARRLRDLIDQVYGERNETDLEFLREEKLRDRIEYLEDLDDLGIHNAYALVQWLDAGRELVVVSSTFAGAAKRLGLADSTAVGRVRKSVSEALGTLSPVAVQAHLTQLGELEGDWPAALQELEV